MTDEREKTAADTSEDQPHEPQQGDLGALDVSEVDRPEQSAEDEQAGPTAGGEPATEDEQAAKPKAAKPKAAPGRRRAAETTTSKSAPKARRRDGAPDPAVLVRAEARYVRCSPRKARLVIDNIRGKSVAEARAILTHTPRAASRDVTKLLESCVANAENNHELFADELHIRKVYVDEGPTLKRFRPRALGRATRIRKRTSHMTIVLGFKR